VGKCEISKFVFGKKIPKKWNMEFDVITVSHG